MKFYTKKDALHGFFVWGFMLLCLLGLLYVLFYVRDGALVPMVILLALTVFLVAIWFNTSYEFKEDHILVRFGVLREKIHYMEITNIVPSRSLLSSYALSRDRLAIYTGGKIRAYISPKDQENFIIELEKHVDTQSFSL